MFLLLFLSRFTHLNHEPFTYIINVNNGNNAQVLCTARIFMAPKFDERGTEMMFRDQRHLMIELDRFVIACKYSNSGTHMYTEKTQKAFCHPFLAKCLLLERSMYILKACCINTFRVKTLYKSH